ncbi:hypothetical protein BdWA1_002457 [Babesia duncani]|uniref:Uncharacterized protein n=1 Tax=Babesia duncani TaxID=323732 RepID=A0AAD9PJI9_9APIC|nr:hypothetical protein BdWA1_002457 [Babesia duncani]
MKLPFILNSVAGARTGKEIDQIFSKLLKVLHSLEGHQISHCLNILSKKNVEHSRTLWLKAAELLTDGRVNKNYNVAAKHIHEKGIISTYDVKDACIILNAFANVDVMCMRLINATTSVILDHIRNVHISDICKVIHSLGKFKKSEPLTKIICAVSQAYGKKLNRNGGNSLKDAESFIRQMNERDFSMFLRACLLNNKKEYISDLSSSIRQFLSTNSTALSDQSIAILVNSLARYGRDDNGLLLILSPIITTRLKQGSFTSQCIAQISNGYSRLGIRDTELLETLAKRMEGNISNYSVRSIINCLNAMCNLSYYHHGLFTAAAINLEGRVTEMTPQCIGNVVASYSKYYHLAHRKSVSILFRNIARHLETIQSFDSFVPQNYANILNGLSKSQIDAPGCFVKLAGEIVKLQKHLNALDISILLNAYARVKLVIPELLDCLCSKIKCIIHQLKPLEFSGTLNSLTILYDVLKSTEASCNTSTIILDAINLMKDSLTAELINKFRCLDVRLVLNSLARSNIIHVQIYDMLLEQLIPNSNYLSLVDISNVTNVYFKFGLQFPDTFCKFITKWFADNQRKVDNDFDLISILIKMAHLGHFIDEILLLGIRVRRVDSNQLPDLLAAICLHYNHYQCTLTAPEFFELQQMMRVAIGNILMENNCQEIIVFHLLSSLNAIDDGFLNSCYKLLFEISREYPLALMSSWDLFTSVEHVQEEEDSLMTEFLSSIAHYNPHLVKMPLFLKDDKFVVIN